MKKGSIFILSVWAITTLAVFSFYLGHSARSKISFIAALDRRDKVRAATESAVLSGIAHVSDKTKESPNLLYLNVLEAQKTDDTIIKMGYNNVIRVSDCKAEYFITDEESKINLNSISVTVLTELIKSHSGFEEEEAGKIAESLIDWIDADNERPGLKFTNNEDLYYELNDFPYGPRNSAFEVPEELLLVKDMTPEIYVAVKPYVTVYGNGKVNINTCGDDVLSALGLPRGLIDKIMFFRLERFAKRPKADGVFENVLSIIEELGNFAFLGEKEKDLLNSLINDGKIGVDSEFFNVTGITEIPGARNRFFSYCIIDKEGNIKYWKEDFFD